MASSREQQDWRHAAAGCAAGLVSVLALQPLDVVKTRLQGRFNTHRLHIATLATTTVQDGMQSVLPSYRGTLDAMATMVRQEGWRSLYAGLYPAMIGSCMSWSLYFYAYNAAKRRHRGTQPTAQLLPHQHMLSALEAGALVCLITNPVWVVKTRLQLQQRAALTKAVAAAPPYAGFVDAVRSIARQEGLGGFYKGLGPSMLLVSHGAIQFVVYEELKRIAAAGYERPGWLSNAPDASSKQRQVSSSEITAAGALSKLAASVVTYPFQVVRARLQQRQNRALRYVSGMQVVRLTLRREGIQGLYKGLVPSMLRVMPQSAITLLVYESVLRRL